MMLYKKKSTGAFLYIDLHLALSKSDSPFQCAILHDDIRRRFPQRRLADFNLGSVNFMKSN